MSTDYSQEIGAGQTPAKGGRMPISGEIIGKAVKDWYAKNRVRIGSAAGLTALALGGLACAVPQAGATPEATGTGARSTETGGAATQETTVQQSAFSLKERLPVASSGRSIYVDNESINRHPDGGVIKTLWNEIIADAGLLAPGYEPFLIAVYDMDSTVNGQPIVVYVLSKQVGTSSPETGVYHYTAMLDGQGGYVKTTPVYRGLDGKLGVEERQGVDPQSGEAVNQFIYLDPAQIPLFGSENGGKTGFVVTYQVGGDQQANAIATMQVSEPTPEFYGQTTASGIIGKVVEWVFPAQPALAAGEPVVTRVAVSTPTAPARPTTEAPKPTAKETFTVPAAQLASRIGFPAESQGKKYAYVGNMLMYGPDEYATYSGIGNTQDTANWYINPDLMYVLNQAELTSVYSETVAILPTVEIIRKANAFEIVEINSNKTIFSRELTGIYRALIKGQLEEVKVKANISGQVGVFRANDAPLVFWGEGWMMEAPSQAMIEKIKSFQPKLWTLNSKNKPVLIDPAGIGYVYQDPEAATNNDQLSAKIVMIKDGVAVGFVDGFYSFWTLNDLENKEKQVAVDFYSITDQTSEKALVPWTFLVENDSANEITRTRNEVVPTARMLYIVDGADMIFAKKSSWLQSTIEKIEKYGPMVDPTEKDYVNGEQELDALAVRTAIDFLAQNGVNMTPAEFRAILNGSSQYDEIKLADGRVWKYKEQGFRVLVSVDKEISTMSRASLAQDGAIEVEFSYKYEANDPFTMATAEIVDALVRAFDFSDEQAEILKQVAMDRVINPPQWKSAWKSLVRP